MGECWPTTWGRSATRGRWPPGSRRTPGVVDHGLFGPELVSDVLVGRGERVQALELSPG